MEPTQDCAKQDTACTILSTLEQNDVLTRLRKTVLPVNSLTELLLHHQMFPILFGLRQAAGFVSAMFVRNKSF